MVLTSTQISSKNIVQIASGKQATGQRDTTYDATVGEIISSGKSTDGTSFTLKSRGVVWVVSSETFSMPADVTGLATLRTSWAHDGVFALNVGVLDPGWNGPIGTVLVNFGRDDFVVSKGQPFLRVLFFENQSVGAPKILQKRDEYIRSITGKSHRLSDTFLNMSSLVNEVSDKVLGLPRWGYRLTMLALFVSLISIFAPIGYSVWTDHQKEQATVGMLERKVQALEDQAKEASKQEQERLSPSTQKRAASSK